MYDCSYGINSVVFVICFRMVMILLMGLIKGCYLGYVVRMLIEGYLVLCI